MSSSRRPRPTATRSPRRSHAPATAAREWSRSALARADALSAAAEALQAAKDDVIDLMVREVGKPLTEATQEHGRSVRILRYHAQAALDADGETYPGRAARRPAHAADRPPPPARRRRADHALELPVRDPAVEGGARARLRQRGRAQAGVGRDRLRAAAGRDPRRRSLPDGVFNVVTGPGEAGQARRRPRRRRLVHRLDRGRARRRPAGGRARHPGAVRDGRPERLDRAARRRRRGAPPR